MARDLTWWERRLAGKDGWAYTQFLREARVDELLAIIKELEKKNA